MKILLYPLLLLCFNLLFATTFQTQINLKTAKNLLKSKTSKVTMGNPCDNNGTVKITERSKAFTMYKNVLKQIDIAENFASKGLTKSADKNIANAEKYLGHLLKKEPNADLSKVCNRIKSLRSKSKSEASSTVDLAHISYFLNRYYSRKGIPAKP